MGLILCDNQRRLFNDYYNGVITLSPYINNFSEVDKVFKSTEVVNKLE
jgi:hypothetical protein